MERLQIGSYVVLFDTAGATIERSSDERYRVEDPSAATLRRFIKYHVKLCQAMNGRHPERLEPYRVQDE